MCFFGKEWYLTMDNNNVDMAKLMNMISKMDKNELQQGLAKLNQMMSKEDKEKLLKQFKNCN